MIINLDYDRDIYISKDTVMAYALEKKTNLVSIWKLNEVIESTECQNWTPRHRKKTLFTLI